jgi:undecaprenyl-diphosphatase
VSFLHLFVLSVVQGITEFLPISSSGHLALVPLLTNWADQGLALDIATHVGTLFAVLIYFRSDIFFMLRSVFGKGDAAEVTQGRQMTCHLIIGSIPAVLAGAAIYFLLDIDLRSLLMIAVMTLFFGAVLGFADWFFKGKRTLRNMNSWDALFIGIFQIFALFPGTSRSGVTMTAGLLRGLDRRASAHFSMLLSIPVIAGAGLALSTKVMAVEEFTIGVDALIAAGAAFMVAYLVIKLLMNWISKIGYMPFVIYRLFLGVFLLWLYIATA